MHADDLSKQSLKVHNSGLITYTGIDTTPGQSGSPISCDMVHYFGGIEGQELVGVHTGGTDLKNWGTLLNEHIIKWIKSQDSSKDRQLVVLYGRYAIVDRSVAKEKCTNECCRVLQ